MAKVYRSVNGRKLTNVIALNAGVQAELERRTFEHRRREGLRRLRLLGRRRRVLAAIARRPRRHPDRVACARRATADGVRRLRGRVRQPSSGGPIRRSVACATALCRMLDERG